MNPTDPAFPVPFVAFKLGMDLRTYMATAILTGLVNKADILGGKEAMDDRADYAARQTDALIERLNAK